MGRITDWDVDCIFIDDGSALSYAADPCGAKVQLHSPHSFHQKSFVKVTGICVVEYSPDLDAYQRAIRTKTNDDVVVLQP
jgi:hypothetical protein